MRVLRFRINNFKGIADATVDISGDAPGNIGTLIGLNESGKTTILEALSNFVTEDQDTANLVRTVHQKSSLQDLIPKDQKAAFTGSIVIEATVEVNQDDIDGLAAAYSSAKELVLDMTSVPNTFTIQRVYRFKDSRHIKTETLWSLAPRLKTKRAKKFRPYTGLDNDSPEDKVIWLFGISYLRRKVPKIVYFPTFLFDFPDRIYLEQEEDDDTNGYYVQVMQDVLDSNGEGLNIQRHIIERVARMRTEHPTIATFMAYVFGRDEKKQIDAVLQKASNEMSRVIFGSWNQLLGRTVTGKRVQIDWALDAERENAPYLEVSIVDGQSKYSLSERSLGFRWFFSFLLFTQFRRNRLDSGATIFLFDEPAANLHSKAQMKLLESFPKIATGHTHIIYSTHSHYMINPLWLERAYIVENRALDYDSEDDVDAFAVRKTDVRAIRYRTFVGSNPTKTTYFQPVMDALDIPLSPMMSASEALIIEGKNDFHPFVYLFGRYGGERGPHVFPGNGAGDLGCLVSLFRGWGVKFRVLLDDDRAGRQAKARYQTEYLLSPEEVVTLGEISDQLAGREFEAVYGDDVRTAVAERFEVSKPSKRHFSLFFQEAIASSSTTKFPRTEESFAPIAAWVRSEFPQVIEDE